MKASFYKIFLIFITFCEVMSSCVSNPRNASSSNKKFIKSTALTVKVSDFHFGSQLLVTYKFPKGWSFPLDEKGQSKNPHQRQYDQVAGYYYKINSAKSSGVLPSIKIIKHINLGRDSDIIKDDQKLMDSISFHLPNIGIYQCYYQNTEYNEGSIVSKDGKKFLTTGNLILYNPTTQQANIIKIFIEYTYEESSTEFNRFFYIDKKGIKIFEAELDESQAFLRLSQDIRISNNGIISIRNIK